MSFRGVGGFGPPSVSRRRYRGGAYAAGDIFDTFGGSDPLGIGTLDDGTGGADGAPDFSDVTGGSSTTSDPTFSTMGLGGLSLPDIGTGIQKILNPFGVNLGGSAAAAGAAAGSAVASSAGRAIKKHIRRMLGAGGGGMHHRMNPGNFKALRRSMRRLAAFERAARHVIKFTHPRPHARVKFKFPKRRKR